MEEVGFARAIGANNDIDFGTEGLSYRLVLVGLEALNHDLSKSGHAA